MPEPGASAPLSATRAILDPGQNGMEAMVPTTKWMVGVGDLADMVARRDAFLADMGVDPDLDEIGQEVDPEDRMSDAALLGAWFDHVAGSLAGDGAIRAHRHIRVTDLDAFVERCEAGVHPGRHWSTTEDTASPDPEHGLVDALLTADVERAAVCWASTFQAWFSHPWEREVTVDGEVARFTVRDMRTGEEREVTIGGAPSPGR